jgi:hypothetical protein
MLRPRRVAAPERPRSKLMEVEDEEEQQEEALVRTHVKEGGVVVMGG